MHIFFLRLPFLWNGSRDPNHAISAKNHLDAEVECDVMLWQALHKRRRHDQKLPVFQFSVLEASCVQRNLSISPDTLNLSANEIVLLEQRAHLHLIFVRSHPLLAIWQIDTAQLKHALTLTINVDLPPLAFPNGFGGAGPRLARIAVRTAMWGMTMRKIVDMDRS